MERYQIESQGHWKYLIVDMTKEVTKLYKDQPTRHSPVMLAYSKRVAEICVAALNNKVAQNSTSTNTTKDKIKPCSNRECEKYDKYYHLSHCGRKWTSDIPNCPDYRA